jgi:hypothetical protein
MTVRSGKALSALTGTCVSILAIAAGCAGEIVSPPERDGTVEQSVHDEGTFELDGDALDSPAPGDDWDNTANALAYTGVLADPAPASIFWTGGSKDIHDITEWRHKDGNVPPKDDLTNAYAAAYDVNGDLVVYFGADRYAQNGDAQMGFWLLQNEVGLNADSTFSGMHADGDVLVLVDFTNGGKVGTINVYEWLSAGGGSDGNLNFVAGGAVLGADDDVFCLADDTACGAVNKEETPSPWPFQSKFGEPNMFPPGAFFEGGVNLSALFGEERCFASFLAESRASQEENAVLKDFVLGSFDTCKEEPPPPPKPCTIEVSKECKVTSKNVDGCDKTFTACFTATVTNTCCEPLPCGTLITVVDDAGTADDPSDDVEVSMMLDAPLDPGGSVQLSGEFQTNENPPLDNVVHATADTGSEVIEASSEPTACQCLAE